MLRFGSVVVDPPVALAPMAGVTNWPFRLLCKEQGCGLVVTEFVSDKALLFENEKTIEMIELLPAERPTGVQIFGADPSEMARAAQLVVERVSPDFIDINMGCPAPKVTKGRGGSSLLREPCVAAEVTEAVIKAVAPLPVTVKIRIGWGADSINAVEVAKHLEGVGAQLLTVHGRTRDQHYSGSADWAVISEVAQAVSVPVIGNGDIRTPEEAKYRLETSGCAGIAIGRGAHGNPWIFRRVAHYLKTGELLPEPTLSERITTALRHLELMVSYRGEYIGVREMRKHAAWYLKGLRDSAAVRDQINRCETALQMENVLKEFAEQARIFAS